jgi:hypothetical protein
MMWVTRDLDLIGPLPVPAAAVLAARPASRHRTIRFSG